MIRPSIQPDELLAGYWPRAARWNGLEPAGTAQEFKRRLLERGAALEFGSTNLERIAGIAAMPLRDLLQRHSMLPLLSLFADERGPSFRWRERVAADAGLAKFSFLCPRDNETLLCPCCVKEDLDFHGFSNWRRDHQLVGAYWCLKHGCELLALPGSGVVAMLRAPSFHLAVGAARAPRAVSGIRFSRPIRRVLEIQSQLLGATTTLSRARLQFIAKKRAEVIGLRTQPSGSGPRLSDLILDKFGNAWPKMAYPGLLNRVGKNKVRCVDAVLNLRRAGPPIVYAMIFAAMWDSSDEAVASMFNEEISLPRHKPLARPTDRDILRSYEANLGLSTAMMADLGICLATLTLRLNRLGLPSLFGRRKMALAAVHLDGQNPVLVSRHWQVPLAELKDVNPEHVKLLRKVLKKLMAREPSDSRLTKQRNAIRRGDFTTYRSSLA